MSRRRWRILGAVALALVAVSLLFVFVLYAPLAAWAVREKAVPKLERKLGVPVAVSSIEVGRGHATLRNVAIGATDDQEPLAVLDEVRVHFGFWSSLTGSPDVASVIVVGPAIDVRLGDPRVESIAAALRRDGGDGEDAGAGGGESGGLRPRRLEVRGGSLRVRHEDSGSVLTTGAIEAALTPGEPVSLRVADVDLRSKLVPPAGAESVELTADAGDPRRSATIRIAGGRAKLWPGMTLTDISGTLKPTAASGDVDIDLAGSYGGMREELWNARGTVNPSERVGAVELEARKFELSRIQSVLEGTGVVDPDQTTVGASLHVKLGGTGASFEGRTEVAGLNVFEPKLAEKTIRNIHARLDIRGQVNVDERKLELESAEVVLGDQRPELVGAGGPAGASALAPVRYQLSGSAQLGDPAAPEDDPASRPRLSVRFAVPEVPCQAVLESIPPDFVPYLEGFELRGRFAADVELAIDWADLDDTVLDGSVGIRGCKVVRAPEELAAERVKKPFEHWVEVEGGKWVSFEIGPDNPDFVPIDDISPHLVNSIMTTEDSRFYRHRGFIPSEFRSALVKDLEAGYFRYGASSITMQMVKNVILYREKTVARKFQELFFTWYLESELDKDRIMEIYLNAIEYGPGLYGIGPATKEYFGKHPRDINPVEAAFFSSILPNPKKRYQQYCDGNLTRWTEKKIQRILALMNKRDRLGEQEYMLASVMPLEFAIKDEISPRECKERAQTFLEQKGSSDTNPRKR